MTTTKRTYENLYIIDINNTDEQIQTINDRFAGVVTEQGGEVLASGLWDKRKLAYSINGKNEGCYMLMYFTGEPNVCAELDRVMRISDDVIRHLILNVEPQNVDVSLIRRQGAQEPAAVAETTSGETQAEQEPEGALEEEPKAEAVSEE